MFARDSHLPLRVLHVIGRMDRAGTETWLRHVVHRIDRQQFQMDFLVHDQTPGDLDDDIHAAGCEILRCEPLRNLWNYKSRLASTLASRPPYDVIHCHQDSFGGFALRAAQSLGIPVRVAHAHTDVNRSVAELRMPVRVVGNVGIHLARQYATCGLAASPAAARSLYGSNWKTDDRWRVLSCGIELDAFEQTADRAALASRLGIPHDVPILGHVGRLIPVKNQRLILRLAEQLRDSGTSFHVVIVGDGPLRTELEQQIRDRSLHGYVTLAGKRSDVPALLSSLFDVFLFPSEFEGLGLALVEAQAAGCRSVISSAIPEESVVIPEIVETVPISAPVDAWAQAVKTALQTSISSSQRLTCLQQVRASVYNIDVSTANLCRFYCEQMSLAQFRTRRVA